jgi:hypothetical protein
MSEERIRALMDLLWIGWRRQEVAVVDALHGVDLDVGFLVPGEGDVGEHQ